MISSYMRQGQHILRRWVKDPGVHRIGRGAAAAAAGFCLSAASLEQGMLPLAAGLVWACRGWQAVAVTAGGALGYELFWGAAGSQSLVWLGLALLGVLLLGDRRITRELPLLIPAVGMLTVSGTGLLFQLGGDTTGVSLYLVRVALAGAAPWIFSGGLRNREPVLGWLCWGLFALGLAQIAPVSWLGLGFLLAGFAGVRGPLPQAAAVGLALDLAGITPVPMTGVTVLSFFLRFLPGRPPWIRWLGPGFMGLAVMYLTGRPDAVVLPGLFLGGLVTGLLPDAGKTELRRGDTGVAQVRLEVAAGVLQETRRLLEDLPERPVDTDALVLRAVGDACAGCSGRNHCRDTRKLCQLSGAVLGKPLLSPEELPVQCKKGGRVLASLRQAQEQLRSMEGTRRLQQEYREAVVQQYMFLEDFLTELSDTLSRREPGPARSYDPVVFIYGNRRRSSNGDRCLEFPGVQNRYYVLLCDGMGTGPGAVREGKKAAALLQRMLACGFPAEHALRSLNSLCALRDRAGAVTVDLAELRLDTGRITLYKWGAPSSFLVGAGIPQTLGAVSPPPGLWAGDTGTASCSLTLGRGQLLLLVSDALEEDKVLEVCRKEKPLAPAALGEALLRQAPQEDDATVVTIHLIPTRS